MNNYQKAKAKLKELAKTLKKNSKDKPLIMQSLNETCDYFIRFGGLTDYQANLLDNYCCTLHPKK